LEVSALTEPENEDIAAIIAWLKKNGVCSSCYYIFPMRDFISVEMSIENAESMLHTEFGHFQHASSGSFPRTIYSLDIYVKLIVFLKNIIDFEQVVAWFSYYIHRIQICENAGIILCSNQYSF
jgi:hypothetical protein